MSERTPYHPMWEKPVYYANDPQKTHQVHWAELCYDLIHVVAIFMLGNHLTQHLSWLGLASFSFLFVALWVSWGDFVFYNSLYVSRDYKHRIISAFHITTVMIMAASISTILETGWTYFIGAYAVNRIILALLYRRARKHNCSSHGLASEMYRNFLGIGLLFAVAACLPSPWNIVLFAAGILAIQVSYGLPKYGVMRFKNFKPRQYHLSERFSLLLLICLGEGYFKMVLALSEKGVLNIAAEILFNYVLGGVVLFLLAWMYFDFRRNGVMSEDASKPTIAQWWYGHMLLMFCALLISVALKAEVQVYFLDPYPLLYGLLGCVGFAGYLLALEMIQRTLQSKIAYRFANFQVKLVGLALVFMTLLVVLFEGPSLLGNLLYFAAVASQLVIPIGNAYKTLHHEVEAMQKERENTD